MKYDMYVSERKIKKLAKKISKTFLIDNDEALTLIYEEWDLLERLFHEYAKVKEVHTQFIEEINFTYRIA